MSKLIKEECYAVAGIAVLFGFFAGMFIPTMLEKDSRNKCIAVAMEKNYTADEIRELCVNGK